MQNLGLKSLAQSEEGVIIFSHADLIGVQAISQTPGNLYEIGFINDIEEFETKYFIHNMACASEENA